MLVSEPLATALLLATIGALVGASIVLSRASAKLGLPAALLFLTIGVFAGGTRLVGLEDRDYLSAFRLGVAALALILFDGGLNTPVAALRRYIAPAAVLATFGVVATAAITAIGAAMILGFAWPTAILLGVVVSSTDAATVFAVLRGSGISLKRRVGLTLELESGLNDPVAVILTVTVTKAVLAGGEIVPWRVALDVALEIAIGAALGIAIGWAARAFIPRLRLSASGLYPVLTLAIAMIAYGVPTLVHGNGFLAVYVAGVAVGNTRLPYRAGIVRVHDAVAWLSQISMFLVFGLLVDASELIPVAIAGLALSLFIAFVARPVVVALSLVPFRYPSREIAYIGWVGLRGAVPIILALFPVLAGVPGARTVFHIVFFVVVVNAIVPGLTVPWVTRRLALESAEPPSPLAILEIESLQPLSGELQSFYIDEALAVAGSRIGDLPFPDGAAATLIIRGQNLVAATPDTMLEPGDHVYVVSRDEDLAFIQLMFGRPEE